MKFELSDMYKYLLSHTFPGLLLGIEILIMLQWFADYKITELIEHILSSRAGNIVIFAVVAYALSTSLGFIIDAIHHFLYEDLPEMIGKKKDDDENDEANKFDAIINSDIMKMYVHFVDDDLYYPYEAWANLSIVMFPGIFLLCYWLLSIIKLKVISWGFLLPSITYIVIFIIVIYEAKHTLNEVDSEEVDFVKALKIKK
jgi:hypothetical protein